eukprot:TRINITY_DN1405_c3_g1_i1.p1 TRINITY_DN1405_c3_g1~~TRINITY_DN1405_c3_g1_i1.p1  ORF type:complete len:269 (+),score=92.52 TRINITY_DN1405_c3_g1_i1:52-858(+)
MEKGIKIDINREKIEENLKEQKIQLIPANIEYNGNANIDTYFTSTLTKTEYDIDPQNSVDSNKFEETYSNSFRGIELIGAVLQVPPKYTGLILKENNNLPINDINNNDDGNGDRSSNNKKYNINGTYKEITYWNREYLPSKSDVFPSSVQDWCKISTIVHEPITQEMINKYKEKQQNKPDNNEDNKDEKEKEKEIDNKDENKNDNSNCNLKNNNNHDEENNDEMVDEKEINETDNDKNKKRKLSEINNKDYGENNDDEGPVKKKQKTD